MALRPAVGSACVLVSLRWASFAAKLTLFAEKDSAQHVLHLLPVRFGKPHWVSECESEERTSPHFRHARVVTGKLRGQHCIHLLALPRAHCESEYSLRGLLA